MRRHLAGAAGAVLLALGASACGSDDPDGSSKGEPSTTPEPTETVADTAPAEEEPVTYRVTFRVSGPEAAGIRLGDGEQKTVELPWENTADYELGPFGSVTVIGASVDLETPLTCEAVFEGEVVASETDTATCSASFTVPTGAE